MISTATRWYDLGTMLQNRAVTFLQLVSRHTIDIVYPPTKAKLHRILHMAGTAMTLAFVLSTWLLSELPTKTKIATDLVVVVAYLTRWQAVVARADKVVDRLPISDSDTPT